MVNFAHSKPHRAQVSYLYGICSLALSPDHISPNLDLSLPIALAFNFCSFNTVFAIFPVK